MKLENDSRREPTLTRVTARPDDGTKQAEIICITIRCDRVAMTQWYRKNLGRSWQVFLAIRELRDLRYASDPAVTPDRGYTIAENADTGVLWVFLPPGNEAFARECRTTGCAEPVFGPDTYYVLAIEELPVVVIIRQAKDGHRPK